MYINLSLGKKIFSFAKKKRQIKALNRVHPNISKVAFVCIIREY